MRTASPSSRPDAATRATSAGAASRALDSTTGQCQGGEVAAAVPVHSSPRQQAPTGSAMSDARFSFDADKLRASDLNPTDVFGEMDGEYCLGERVANAKEAAVACGALTCSDDYRITVYVPDHHYVIVGVTHRDARIHSYAMPFQLATVIFDADLMMRTLDIGDVEDIVTCVHNVVNVANQLLERHPAVATAADGR
jgi:hypothetical protein